MDEHTEEQMEWWSIQADNRPGARYKAGRAVQGRCDLTRMPKITEEEKNYIADPRNENKPRYERIMDKCRRIAQMIRWEKEHSKREDEDE